MKKLLRPNDIKETRVLKRRKKTKKTKGVKRGFYLRSALDVRRLLSRLINECYQVKLDEKVLRTISYASQILLKTMQEGEYEIRLKELEDQLKQVSKALLTSSEKDNIMKWPKNQETQDSNQSKERSVH